MIYKIPKELKAKSSKVFEKLFPNVKYNFEDIEDIEDIEDKEFSSLLYCISLSEYLSQILIKYPGIKNSVLDLIKHGLKGKKDKLDMFFNQDNLLKLFSKRLNKIEKKIKSSKDNLEDNMDVILSIFRCFRHDVMSKILVCDFLKFSSCDTTIKRISSLADIFLLKTLDILHKIFEQEFFILCLGKLGCNELNFSSDIDLIFCVEDKSFNNLKAISMAQKIIQILNQNTIDGFVFRVDMRLRPFGKSGALVSSQRQFIEYLKKDARPWERYVMMKARVISKKPKLANDLKKAIDSFIYRPYKDYTVNETIIEMRSKIEKKLLVEHKEDDFKSGSGGIRDIEFICQTFQLIYGGEQFDFRLLGVFDVLDKLYLKKLISLDQKNGLLEAYMFLRDSENHLQMINNQQIHACPKDSLMRLKLALSMDFCDWGSFLDKLNSHQKFVKKSFDELVKPELSSQDSEFIAIEKVDISKDKSIKANYIKSIFNEIVATKTRYKSADRVLQRQLQRIYIYYSQSLSTKLTDDEKKISYERVAQLLNAIMSRPTYIALLLSSKKIISDLGLYLPKSTWVFSILKQMPYLMALLFTEQKIGLSQINCKEASDDVFNERLRHFKWSSMSKIAQDILSKKIKVDQARSQLTDLAQFVIFEVYKKCWADVVAKRGLPDGAKDFRSSGFAIVSYGKLASSELLFSSDLDLVFLYEDKLKKDESSDLTHKFYVSLVQKILSTLQTKTLSSYLYPIDIRLRPSGGSGLLVSKIEAFEKYQHKNAWVWEHQALMRSRVLFGDKGLVKKFEKIREDILIKDRNKLELTFQINSMRNKIKQEKAKPRSESYHIDKIKYDKGGLNDIEFLVQYLFY